VRGYEGRTLKLGMICLPNKKFINFLIKVDTKDKNFNLQRVVFFTNYPQNKLVGNISEAREDKPHYLQ
jgi:hypothetical protein